MKPICPAGTLIRTTERKLASSYSFDQWMYDQEKEVVMLIKIGPSNESSDIVDLLVACHERIRFFIDLALRLGHTTDASPEDVREGAARVVRYFSESNMWFHRCAARVLGSIEGDPPSD